MGNAYVGLGIAQGAANVQKHIREKPLHNARLAEAKSNQALSEAKLEEYKQGSELRKTETDVALEQAQQSLRALQGQAAQATTFTGFKNYEDSKDVKHLNTALASLKSNPVAGGVYSDVARLDAVTRTPQSEAMLTAAGVTDLEGFFSAEDTHNYVMATGVDGKQNLVNLDQMYVQSGYTKHMSNVETEAMMARQRKEQLAQSGMLYKDMTAMERSARAVQNELGISYKEALDMVRSGNTKSGGSMIERVAQQLMEANGELTYPEAIEKASGMVKSGSALERETKKVMSEQTELSREEAMEVAKDRIQPDTQAQKNLAAADDVTVQLDEAAGGDFFEADMSDRTTRRRVGPLITKLEKLTGQSLSNEDKRMARNFRELTHLGDISSELTDEETGLFDNMLHGVKQYLTDNVDGVGATTAYETIRNAVRHDLFGATLPAGEIRAFNKSLGSLGKQTGPVLKQLQLSMQGVKSKMQAIYDMNDERIAQYYLGSSLEDIDMVIEKLDARIRSVANVGSKPLSYKDVQPVGDFQSKSPEEKTKIMDGIFQGENH